MSLFSKSNKVIKQNYTKNHILSINEVKVLNHLKDIRSVTYDDLDNMYDSSKKNDSKETFYTLVSQISNEYGINPTAVFMYVLYFIQHLDVDVQGIRNKLEKKYDESPEKYSKSEFALTDDSSFLGTFTTFGFTLFDFLVAMKSSGNDVESDVSETYSPNESEMFVNGILKSLKFTRDTSKTRVKLANHLYDEGTLFARIASQELVAGTNNIQITLNNPIVAFKNTDSALVFNHLNIFIDASEIGSYDEGYIIKKDVKVIRYHRSDSASEKNGAESYGVDIIK